MNNRIELKKARLQLYKPSPTKFQLVAKLDDLITHCHGNNIRVNGLRFDSNSFKVGELYVRMIEVKPNDIAHVLIHWYPNYQISNQSDPFCSAYIMEQWEIELIINKLRNIL